MRISYINDGRGARYVPHHSAFISIDDRSFQFSDGVYEVVLAQDGVLIDSEMHWQRFSRSLAALDMASPIPVRAFETILQELMRRNRCYSAMCYLHISRGTATRNHAYPDNLTPNLLISVSPLILKRFPAGGSAITVPDTRWGRPDIKTVSLLPNVLAKKQANKSGCVEAIFYDSNRMITEGSSTNVFIVDTQGCLVTRPLSQAILPGITRERLLYLAEEANIPVVEKPFSVEEAMRARELFISSTTRGAYPITILDGAFIADGKPGPLTLQLQSLYMAFIDHTVASALSRKHIPSLTVTA